MKTTVIIFPSQRILMVHSCCTIKEVNLQQCHFSWYINNRHCALYCILHKLDWHTSDFRKYSEENGHELHLLFPLLCLNIFKSHNTLANVIKTKNHFLYVYFFCGYSKLFWTLPFLLQHFSHKTQIHKHILKPPYFFNW